MRMVVDLPAPFGPRKPVTWPALTVKLMWSTAIFGPYVLARFSAVITMTPEVEGVESRSGPPVWAAPASGRCLRSRVISDGRDGVAGRNGRPVEGGDAAGRKPLTVR